MTVDKMASDKMALDKMTVDKMTVDKMACRGLYYKTVLLPQFMDILNKLKCLSLARLSSQV
jgi:hypothetical protein